MAEASKLTPYSAEYLSLLARKGKLAGKKVDNTWYTTKAVLDDYMHKQMLRAQMLKGVMPAAVTPNVQTDADPSGNSRRNLENYSAAVSTASEIPLKRGIETTENLKHLRSFHEDVREYMRREGLPIAPEDHKAHQIPKDFRSPEDASYEARRIASEFLPSLAPKNEIAEAAVSAHTKATKDVESALERVLDKKLGKGVEHPVFSKPSVVSRAAGAPVRSLHTISRSKVLIMVSILTVVILTVSPVPFVFSAFENSLNSAKSFLTDANTVMGFRPGTHADQILLLDKGGNVAIMGHIETGSELISRVADGTAPIVVDSKTLVNNLNAEYLDGASSTDFTLDFIAKNGAVTSENVTLTGSVEVGQTLLVRGAEKLLGELSVGGDLAVFGDAEFRQALSVAGPATFKGLVTLQDNLSVRKNISVRGSLDAGGAVLGSSGSFGSLGVSGDAGVSGDLSVAGGTTVSGTLTTHTLSVTGAATSTFSGPVFFGGDLSFAGDGLSLPGTTTLANMIVTGSSTINDLAFTNASGTNATTTNLFASSISSAWAKITSLVADDISVGALTATSTVVGDSTTTNATSTTLYSDTGTFNDLFVNNYEQNNGTFAIHSSVATGDIFSVLDTAVTDGTLIHQSLTANAGNGQTSKGQIIDLADQTSAGGGYSALTVNVSGTGTGSGNKYLLDLNPGPASDVVFDASGALRPTAAADINTNSIGSPSFYWKNAYIDTLNANNIAGTVTSGNTSSNTWTIGSSEAGDSEKALIFQRNSGSGNALLSWNASSGVLNDQRFLSVNYPFNATYTISDTSIATTSSLYSGLLTNNTSAGTQKLLSLTNTGTGSTENGIYIDNTGTGQTAFEIAGSWATGIKTNNNSIDAGSGAISTTGGLLFGNATGTNATTTNFFATTASSTNLFAANLAVGGSTLVTSGGNVGIGTSTPSAALSINSSVAETVNGGTMYRLLDAQANSLNQYKIYGSANNVNDGLQILTPNTSFRVDVGSRLTDALLFGSGNSGSGNNTYFSVSRTAATGGSVQLDALNSGVGGTNLLLNTRFGGNIGVGTTNPITKVEVRNDANSQTYLTVTNAQGGSNAHAGLNLRAGSSAADELQIFKASATYGGYKILGARDAGVFTSTGNLSFLNDNSSGVIRFAAGGSSSAQLTLSSAGFLGLGTTTPLAKLDIAGTLGSTTDLFNISSTTATNVELSVFKVQANGKLQMTYPGTTPAFNPGDGGSALLTITSNPSGADGSQVTALLQRNTNATTGMVTGAVLQVNSTATAASGLGTRFRFDAKGSDGTVRAIAGFGAALENTTDAGYLAFQTCPVGCATVSPLERMRITSSGFLGLGTTNPQATFHNAGSTLFGTLAISNLASGGAIGTAAATVDLFTSFNINQTTAGQTLTLPTPTSATAGRIAIMTDIGSASFTIGGTTLNPGSTMTLVWNGSSWAVGGSSGWGLTGNSSTDPATNFLGTTDAEPLVIKTNSVEALRVLAGGNVGIGTTNPNFKLEVSGTASTTNLYATNATTTNATSTNFFASAITSILANLTSLVANSISVNALTAVNSTTTNATTTNLYFTAASGGDLTSSGTGSFAGTVKSTQFQNLSQTSSLGLNATGTTSTTTVDLMEYSSDAAAQAAYVSNGADQSTGGTVTTSGGNTIRTFTTSGTFVPGGISSVSALVVAGGGGAGGAIGGSAGGPGGGGGVISSSTVAVTSGVPVTVTVGDGGTGGTSGVIGNQGGNSVFSSLTAIGGGAGGAGNNAGAGGNGGTGGSGGGGGGGTIAGGTGGAATAGQGFAGGNGAQGGYDGGAGGAGGAGTNAVNNTVRGTSGVGTSSSISGSSVTYAKGGDSSGGTSFGNASSNTGDGGASINGGTNKGWNGGSGVVIVSYPTVAPFLQSYSEPSTKTEGSYAIRGSASSTTSLNKSLTRTVSSPINLTGYSSVTFDIRSTRTGSNLKIGLHDSGGTVTEVTPNVTSANTYQSATLDLSGVSNVDKDAIDQIIITVIDASADNIFYVDNMVGVKVRSNEATLTVNGSEALRADTSGNIGIGTADPNYKIDVAGNLRVSSGLVLTGYTATGGTMTTQGNYTVHVFTSSGSFTPTFSGPVDVLVVGGGGSGGNGFGGGGGGAGGVLYETGVTVTPQAYTITVGAGGAGVGSPSNGHPGGDSSALGFTALGGGYGAGSTGSATAGGPGGSGGGGTGGNVIAAGGAGTAGQGNDGGESNSAGCWPGGGGGGAGAPGGVGQCNIPSGSGGVGVINSISGSPVFYGGGGGGGANSASGGAAQGGTGGGGTGGTPTASATSGTANTGGGGGGGANNTGTSGAGGSGIVIIRYLVRSESEFVVDTRGNVGIGTTNPTNAFSVAGSADFSGNVGIGTTQPVSSLDVQGTGLTLGGVTRTTWPTGSGTGFGVDTGTSAYYTGGNVGIGTTAPDTDTLLSLSRTSGTAGISFMNSGITKGYIGVDVTAGNLTAGSVANDMVIRAQANTIFTSGGSAERMRITSGGNIGIGTTTPGDLLDVNGNLRIESANSIKLFNLNNSNFASIKAASFSTNAADIAFSTGGVSNAFVITNAGQVGIGTTDPTSYLGVSSQLAVNGSLNIGTATNVGSVALGGTVVMSTTNSPLTLTLNSGGFTNVVIPSGNIGIGTTTPASLLDVEANAAGAQGILVRNLSTSASAQAVFRFKNNDASVDGSFGATGSNFTPVGNIASSTFYLSAAATNGLLIGTETSGTSIKFNTGGTATANERMRITGSGLVGIGITNPTHALQLGTDDAAKPTSNTWTIVSDRRLKQNIQTFSDGLDVLNQINPVSYELNGKGGTPLGAKGIGIIAQDVKDIIPYTINTFEAKLNPDDATTTTLYDFNSSALTFVLINGVKELSLQASSTESRLEGLTLDLASATSSIADLQAFASSTVARLDAIEVRVSTLESLLGQTGSSTAALTLDATTTQSIATAVLATISGTIENGLAHLGGLVVDALTIGSHDKPAGVTFYDTVTGDPYCMQVTNGVQITTPGVCGAQSDYVAPITASSTPSDGVTASQASSSDTGTSTATSTDSTATSTDAVITQPDATATSTDATSTSDTVVSAPEDTAPAPSTDTATTTTP